MSESSASAEQRALPQIAVQLGYAGLIPFVALAALAWAMPEARAKAQFAQLAYAAVILSFLGAVHWGLALAANRRDPRPYVWGVIPSLSGWAALLLPYAIGAVLCTVSLIVCWLVDRQTLRGWAFARAYDQLRFRLTVVAWLSVIAARSAPHL
jgi:hypothetical protein